MIGRIECILSLYTIDDLIDLDDTVIKSDKHELRLESKKGTKNVSN